MCATIDFYDLSNFHLIKKIYTNSKKTCVAIITTV